MFTEYVTAGGFINGYEDYGVENGVKELLYAGTTDEGVYKINDDCCEFLLPYRHDFIIGANWGDLSNMGGCWCGDVFHWNIGNSWVIFIWYLYHTSSGTLNSDVGI